MSLFKKKEPKQPREIKPDDALIIKLWYTPRTHAMLVLGIYVFIFAVLILIIRLSPGANVQKNKDLNKTELKELYDATINNSDGYNLSLTDNNMTYYFSGSNQDSVIKGTLLYNGNTKDIIIEDDICSIYKEEVIIDNKTINKNLPLINNENVDIESCPNGVDYKYFDISYIYNIISELNGKYYGKDYYVYRIKNDEEIRVYTSNKLITKIDYKLKNTTYSYTIYKNNEEVNETINDIV